MGAAAHFIFATEDGTISAWGGGVSATLKVDNSDNGSANGAVYKGATSGEINGHKFLYVTNFRSGKVEVYDTTFKRVHLGDDAFNPNGDCDDDQHAPIATTMTASQTVSRHSMFRTSAAPFLSRTPSRIR